ncbi:uncharacterized protein ACIBXB_021535 [Morphnus guianensis]
MGLHQNKSMPAFFLESSADILQFANEDVNKLDCRISPYFTADTQIIWPGKEIRASSSDSWFTCTIKHRARKHSTTAFLMQDQKEREPKSQTAFPRHCRVIAHFREKFRVKKLKERGTHSPIPTQPPQQDPGRVSGAGAGSCQSRQPAVAPSTIHRCRELQSPSLAPWLRDRRKASYKSAAWAVLDCALPDSGGIPHPGLSRPVAVHETGRSGGLQDVSRAKGLPQGLSHRWVGNWPPQAPNPAQALQYSPGALRWRLVPAAPPTHTEPPSVGTTARSQPLAAASATRSACPPPLSPGHGGLAGVCLLHGPPGSCAHPVGIAPEKGRHKTRLFAYSGSSKQVECVARRAEMVLEEIPKGNASLVLRDAEVREEGTYSCLVSVASLAGEQSIQLQIEGNSMGLGFLFRLSSVINFHSPEKPTVTVNITSLSLVEGEQHKLVCNIRHYYPHNTQTQWLQDPKDTWKVPDVMKNVLSSGDQQSSNGTYSSSRCFLLTASLKDSDHKYTCWGDHPSLQSPIRRSVTVEVRGTLLTSGHCPLHP